MLDIVKELFFQGFSWKSLFSVIFINIILSGDNAVLIALAVRNVPKDLQRKANFWGTVGAIVLRIIIASIVVYLLKIPFVMIFGGLLLGWIAFNLLNEKEEEFKEGGASVWNAVKTIIIADLVMSFDNVVALAGVAEGNILMISIGVIISIPLIIGGSNIIIGWMNRFPVILYIGAGILYYTACEMILKDNHIHSAFYGHFYYEKGLTVLITLVMLFISFVVRNKKK